MRGVVLGVAAVVVLLLTPVLHQNLAYHAFADSRRLAGIPNFSNVASNAAFLLAACFGLTGLRRPGAFREPWERTAYILLLAGTAGTALGSAWYHLAPDSQRLVWDRLPMTVVFMSILAQFAGRRWLIPGILFGLTSVIFWDFTDDLRPYVLVQFGSMIAVPLYGLLRPPRYTNMRWVIATAVLYVLAKLLELLDLPLARVVATGGHPWKHLAGAAAVGCYVQWIRVREASENQ